MREGPAEGEGGAVQPGEGAAAVASPLSPNAHCNAAHRHVEALLGYLRLLLHARTRDCICACGGKFKGMRGGAAGGGEG